MSDDASRVSLQPRPYQLDCVQRVKAANTIVSLPTGGGKTLVAVLAIDHFLAKGGKAMFIVPTRVLVAQQAQYCRERCARRHAVIELSGNEMEGWTNQMWSYALRDNEILVGTPEVFRRALVDAGFISVLAFSLIIFDECHNATGNSPMAGIMRDAVWPVAAQPGCPRILGLTASFVNGALKNLEGKRRQLETLLQACLFCPDVPRDMMAGGSAGSSHGRSRFRQVNYMDDMPSETGQLVEEKLAALSGGFESAFGIAIKETGKLVRRTRHVLEELGMSAFCFALREGVVPQLEAHAAQLTELGQNSGARGQAALLRKRLPQLRQHLRTTADALSSDGQLTSVPFVSGKAAALLQLLETLFCGRQSDTSYRGIIFMTQIALTFPAAHLINHHFSAFSPPLVRAGAVSGVGSMNDADRAIQMDDFRAGKINLLVCTNALEEGVDVSDCAVVIRFSHFDTTKSHIQGSGRARRSDAEVYYFANDPDKEESGAKLLQQVAKDSTLELTEAERLERRQEATRLAPGIYPFWPNGRGSELNFFNCLQIVFEYCSKTMGQSFNPEDLFVYCTEEVCAYPRQERSYISEAKYPSPNGMLRITCEDVNRYWGSVKLDDVLDPDRCRNLDQVDKMKRRMLYVVAVDMHQRGLLGPDNQPSATALAGTKLACPAFVMRPGISLKNAFPKGALHHDMPFTGGARNSGFPAPMKPDPKALSQETASSNHKGALNEWALMRWKPLSADQLIHYSTTHGAIGSSPTFVATVELLKLGQSFQGTLQTSKRAAEQAAAQRALSELPQQ